MRKLIKSIREYLGLSQTEFADKIGVTFATVNRWENGRAIPTKLAQTTLYEYCKEHGVPVYQMILEKSKQMPMQSPSMETEYCFTTVQSPVSSARSLRRVEKCVISVRAFIWVPTQVSR